MRPFAAAAAADLRDRRRWEASILGKSALRGRQALAWVTHRCVASPCRRNRRRSASADARRPDDAAPSPHAARHGGVAAQTIRSASHRSEDSARGRIPEGCFTAMPRDRTMGQSNAVGRAIPAPRSLSQSGHRHGMTCTTRLHPPPACGCKRSGSRCGDVQDSRNPDGAASALASIHRASDRHGASRLAWPAGAGTSTAVQI
eukprot:357516-Chlamydomonas_euryale.AAC.25